jgi:hypothetical protein
LPWDAEERPGGFGTRTLLLCMFVLWLFGCGPTQEGNIDMLANADGSVVAEGHATQEEESNLVMLAGAPPETFYSNQRGDVLQASPAGDPVEIRKHTGEVLAWIFHKKAQTSCKSLIEWKV